MLKLSNALILLLPLNCLQHEVTSNMDIPATIPAGIPLMLMIIYDSYQISHLVYFHLIFNVLQRKIFDIFMLD